MAYQNRPKPLMISTTRWPANASMLQRRSRTSCLTKQNAAYLYQIGPWWSLSYYLMQALIVLLLELSFDAVHDPEREEILPNVKKLIRWLRVLKRKDRVAGRAHDLGSGVLQSLASRLNIDLSDFLQEEAAPSARPTSRSSSALGVNDQLQLFFTGEFNYDSGMSHQSMFAFPPRTYQGGLQVPEAAGSAINLPLGSGSPGTSFGNAFSTSYDERNLISSYFPM
ncbi:hypothetical protein C7974DRAFT_457309 [Boeremia exigua]|uniref:uncharacterized protein n=1 Tax=Boeremia exigua TaxID=749465 RepID=UPI001E8E22F1|nr:uncharacterized protein C7974DRAFT_457309 [Boeremia exigua]KAH6622262.1 hypothetical protein C7974DRAFT_457309 [Boeremia exigua]